MESILPFAAVALLALACPLGMAAIGGAAWLVARARGQKKEFSAGCMGGHGEHQPTESADVTGLRGEIARLQGQVEALQTESANRTGAGQPVAADFEGGLAVAEEIKR